MNKEIRKIIDGVVRDFADRANVDKNNDIKRNAQGRCCDVRHVAIHHLYTDHDIPREDLRVYFGLNVVSSIAKSIQKTNIRLDYDESFILLYEELTN